MRILIFALFVITLACSTAGAAIEDFLTSLNIQAKADLPGFSAKVSAQFGVPQLQVQTVIQTVKEPADAFMVFQLGQMSKQPTEVVIKTYKAKHGAGWGAMAKELGIKPGSAAFHALKRGDFALTGVPGGDEQHGKGKGKGKGHNK